MTITVTFALGTKESYFFNSPTHWAWHNLPADVEALFTSTPPIKDVIEFALGANGTYFLSYYDAAGQAQCRHYNLPNPLVEFLYAGHPAVVRDLATLSVALGPWDSYYAWDRACASWSNLPASLEKAVLNRLERQDATTTTWKADGYEAPCFVSLGADGSYFMRTVCGGGSWDLKVPLGAGKGGLGVVGGDGMEGLRGTNKFLEESRDFSSVAGLHLFPAQANAYVLVLTSGKSFSNLPECTWADYNKLAPALPAFVQTKAPIPPIPQPQLPPQPQSQPQPYAQQSQPQPYAQQSQPQPYAQQSQPQPYAQQPQFLPPAAHTQGQMHAHAGAQTTCCPPAVAPHNCCVPPPPPSSSHGGLYGP